MTNISILMEYSAKVLEEPSDLYRTALGSLTLRLREIL